MLPSKDNLNGALPLLQSVLERTNARAARAIARAAPLRLRTAQSEADMEAVFRLRYLTVIEKGWAEPTNFPDGGERDEYDDRAIHVVAWDGSTLAATTRIVTPRPGSRLPTEEVFGVSLKTNDRVVDVGRLCVSPTYRSREHRVWMALLGQTWFEMRVRGFTEACSSLTPGVARIYRSIGLQVTALGSSRNYWGRERFPAHVTLGRLVPH